jgi:hypothetical protein
MEATKSKYRSSTWALVILLGLAGYYLEQHQREMHLSKLLYFAALGAFARDEPKLQRWVMLGMVGLMWVVILGTWYQYRNQHLVPMGKGVYRIENH